MSSGAEIRLKTGIILGFVILLAVLFAPPVRVFTKPATAVADFYVAPNGNDGWSGTLAAANSSASDGPFKSFDRARRAVQQKKGRTGKSEIVVMFRGGIYYLPDTLHFTASDSGSPTQRVVYEAYPHEVPVISGGVRITGWKNASPGRWVTDLPSNVKYFEQLWVNGQRRYRPRTTRTKYLYKVDWVTMDSPSGNCSLRMPNRQFGCLDRFRFKPGDIRADWSNLHDVEIDNFERWTMSKLRLQSVDTRESVAYTTGPTMKGRMFGFEPQRRYLVENVKEALSQPGEWYLDRSASPWRLTYLSAGGEDPNSVPVIAPQQSPLLVSEGLRYVTFKGLKFSHENWVVPPEGHPGMPGEPRVPAALSFTDSSYVILDACEVSRTGSWGLEFVGSGPVRGAPTNQVINSALFDLGTGGIRIGQYPQEGDTDSNVAQGNLIKNNVVEGGGRILPGGIGTGIWVGNSHNNTLSHNEIYDFYTGAIDVGATLNYPGSLAHDNLVEYNLVYQLGQGVTNDMGGIYTRVSTATGNKILNNVVHDVTQDLGPRGYGGQGIYLDQGSSGVLIQNNLVYRVSESGFFVNLGENDTATNNIFAFARQGAVKRGRDENHLTLTFTHNIVLWDQDTPIQKAGSWACADESGSSQPCTSFFKFDYNLYWSPNGRQPTFMTTRFMPGQYGLPNQAGRGPGQGAGMGGPGQGGGMGQGPGMRRRPGILGGLGMGRRPDMGPMGGGNAMGQNPEEMRRRLEILHDFQEWLALGEDQHSMVEDPHFENPAYPHDDFKLRPGSPVSKMNFAPFDYGQAGRLPGAGPSPPAQPPAFPLQLLEPKDY